MNDSSGNDGRTLKHPRKGALGVAGFILLITIPAWRVTAEKMADAIVHPSVDGFFFFISARPFLVFWLIYFAFLSLILPKDK